MITENDLNAKYNYPLKMTDHCLRNIYLGAQERV